VTPGFGVCSKLNICSSFVRFCTISLSWLHWIDSVNIQRIRCQAQQPRTMDSKPNLPRQDHRVTTRRRFPARPYITFSNQQTPFMCTQPRHTMMSRTRHHKSATVADTKGHSGGGRADLTVVRSNERTVERRCRTKARTHARIV